MVHVGVKRSVVGGARSASIAFAIPASIREGIEVGYLPPLISLYLARNCDQPKTRVNTCEIVQCLHRPGRDVYSRWQHILGSSL